MLLVTINITIITPVIATISITMITIRRRVASCMACFIVWRWRLFLAFFRGPEPELLIFQVPGKWVAGQVFLELKGSGL